MIFILSSSEYEMQYLKLIRVKIGDVEFLVCYTLTVLKKLSQTIFILLITIKSIYLYYEQEYISMFI